LEFAEIMVHDALERAESCGGHFREEYQTAEGEALRRDDDFAHAAVWGFAGEAQPPTLHKEDLSFDNVKLTTRSYK
jgi:succinate dehydrogenase / fumarate reductase flavoprotein subunit